MRHLILIVAFFANHAFAGEGIFSDGKDSFRVYIKTDVEVVIRAFPGTQVWSYDVCQYPYSSCSIPNEYIDYAGAWVKVLDDDHLEWAIKTSSGNFQTKFLTKKNECTK